MTLGRCLEGVSPIPCKVTHRTVSPARPIRRSAPRTSRGSRRTSSSAAGPSIERPLAPGRYRMTASRGPEYDIVAMPGDGTEPAPVSFALRRVVDTSGWVASDFHSALGAQRRFRGRSATRDRVIANAAEGLEVAVASEHNVVAGFLSRRLPKSSTSRRSWSSSPASRCRATRARNRSCTPTSSPVRPAPGSTAQRRAGRSRSPRERRVRRRARAAEPGGQSALAQINHPRSGANGYFHLLGFDSKSAFGTAPGYVAAFDAIEVWNGRDVRHRTTALRRLFRLLRTSRRDADRRHRHARDRRRGAGLPAHVRSCAAGCGLRRVGGRSRAGPR